MSTTHCGLTTSDWGFYRKTDTHIVSTGIIVLLCPSLVTSWSGLHIPQNLVETGNIEAPGASGGVISPFLWDVCFPKWLPHYHFLDVASYGSFSVS